MESAVLLGTEISWGQEEERLRRKITYSELRNPVTLKLRVSSFSSGLFGFTNAVGKTALGQYEISLGQMIRLLCSE